ncbi:outer membrane protein assembly factor BamB family protein [Haloplanus aerogenes]|uniref:Putative pyrroloquinoline-quinone binding quinoprotein n=1 Tax=Haloplanus aerogenes TaxID=660522 RepID=A0A3M0E0X8_9EURY|nr:PQQ-binding-like beta-propeller repeat protein [Haloplanus aerogenes]AZH25601.1 hypothetical protein DU502_09495 [Haloplanus aerogenes]RMB25323.1 putative pyrroloquinoline-quinone binding quinoprotein [Haloplanus aerogenes]
MPSITRRRLLGSGVVATLAAGTYGAYRLHRGATDATFAPWTPTPGTWPLRRYDPANTAHNPNATPPRESPPDRTVVSAATTARQPRFAPLVGADHLVTHGSGLVAVPRGGEQLALERDTSIPLAGFGPDGHLHTVDADRPATVVGYDTDLREAYRTPLRDDNPQGLTVSTREVYVGCESGAVRSLDPDSGRRWRVDGAMPALADGRLYAADAPLDGTVAYAPRTGLDRRLDVGPERVWSAGPTDGFPHPPAVAEGRLVLGTYAEGGGVVVALDTDSGDRLWEPRPLGRDVATPAIVGDRGYTAVETADGSGAVVALDLTTGETRWRDDVEWAATTPVVAGETLVVAGERADGTATVRAYDAGGDVLWTHAFEAGTGGAGGLALVEDRVLVTVGATLYELSF